MFRLRLHPSPLGLALGIAVIAFWAVLWLSILVQLHRSATVDAEQSPAVHAIARADPLETRWAAP